MNRLIRFAAVRDVQLRRPLAERLVTAAKEALPARDGAVERQVLAADLGLLSDIDTQIAHVERELATLLPLSPYATLTSVPSWDVVRAATYGATLGNRIGGRARGRCTGQLGSRLRSTSRPVSAAMERSAAKAVWRCAER